MTTRWFLFIMGAMVGLAGTLRGETEAVEVITLPREPVSESLRREADAAMSRAMQWLISRQHPEGYWSTPDFPALTALPLWALIQGGSGDREAMNRAVSFLVSRVNEDGSICVVPTEMRRGGGLCNYNTAMSMVALHAWGDPEHIPIIQQARHFVAAGQHLGGDVYFGGMGYDADTGRAYADLSNSYVAYEAMRLTESVEDLRADMGQRADLNWEAVVTFLERVQNLPGPHAQPWVTDDPNDRGGFVYTPEMSMAGSITNEAGDIRLRSYGSMTYAGLLSFIYAEVDRNDPRVQAAFEWSLRHWNLDENPGMGLQGLYYYYQTLAKALATFGEEILHLEGDRAIAWREHLIRKLISVQQVDPDSGGVFWVNSEGRWWEADPVLVTSYTLLALAIALNL
ncbi:MAG TPA: terpene cyclase/mutase family protein [Kiritimatiellia bacterium]|nr:terpene cyclase/mutase family protein [Kiritimatiellia bacterium]